MMLYQVLQQKLTILNSLPNKRIKIKKIKKIEKFSYVYGWLKVSSIIMTPKHQKTFYAWVSTGHFYKEYEN